jgi:hypothetical protein
VCAVQLQDYISITVDDGNGPITAVYTTAYAYQDSLGTGGAFGTAFSYYDNTPVGTTYLYFGVGGEAVGDYSNNNSIYSIQDNENQWNFGQGQTFSSFEIAEFGAIGEPVIGTFSGTLTNFALQPPADVTVTGSFNITRQ